MCDRTTIRVKSIPLSDNPQLGLLGWLIDRQNRKVYIYRPNREVEILDNPKAVTGNLELPEFVLRMAKIW